MNFSEIAMEDDKDEDKASLPDTEVGEVEDFSQQQLPYPGPGSVHLHRHFSISRLHSARVSFLRFHCEKNTYTICVKTKESFIYSEVT